MPAKQAGKGLSYTRPRKARHIQDPDARQKRVTEWADEGWCKPDANWFRLLLSTRLPAQDATVSGDWFDGRFDRKRSGRRRRMLVPFTMRSVEEAECACFSPFECGVCGQP